MELIYRAEVREADEWAKREAEAERAAEAEYQAVSNVKRTSKRGVSRWHASVAQG